MTGPPIVLIAGPTASGKSALALALAERLEGTIINADSMQVYRELRVLTARPSREEEARVPHRLFGTVPGATAFSTGEWFAAAAGEIGTAFGAGRAVIVVGGTGLYFKALTEGLAPIPVIPHHVRTFWRGEAARRSSEALHDLLSSRDPLTAARLNPTDPQRIVRALEVFEVTGRPLAELQAETGGPAHPALTGALRLALVPDRAWLDERIVLRARHMLSGGGVDEVRALKALHLPSDLPVMKAIGVPELGALIDGRCTPDDAEAAVIQSTRRYAKRQSTWIRGQMGGWTVVDPMEADADEIARQLPLEL